MQKTKNIKRENIEEDYINNEIDYDIILTEEDIESLREAERERARGEGMEARIFFKEMKERYGY